MSRLFLQTVEGRLEPSDLGAQQLGSHGIVESLFTPDPASGAVRSVVVFDRLLVAAHLETIERILNKQLQKKIQLENTKPENGRMNFEQTAPEKNPTEE